MKLGIDFGTTRTVVACADRGNYPDPQLLRRSGRRSRLLPVGRRRARRRASLRLRCARGCRRRSVVHRRALLQAAPRRRARRSGQDGHPRQHDHRRRRARHALPRRDEGGGPHEVEPPQGREARRPAPRTTRPIRSVVAVPANASGAQRFVTLDAFRRAGFGPIAMLNEPSAAGFEFTHRHRDTLTSRRDHVVVFDLGGGTFDASLVRMRGRSHEVLATGGVNRLGGDDFDAVLVDLVLARAGLDARRARPRRARSPRRSVSRREGAPQPELAQDLD